MPKIVSLVRENIIKVAETLFVKYGIKSIKVDDICNELHMSKKTFYSEFENKEALIEIVWSRICQKGPEHFNNVKEIDTCDNIIDLWLQGPSVAVKEHNKKHEIFVYDLLKYYPDIHKKQVKEREAHISEVLRKVLNKGVEQGLFRDDLNLDYLVPLCNGWNDLAINAFLKLPKNEHKKYLRFLLDTFMRMVCSEKGLAYYMENHYQVEK